MAAIRIQDLFKQLGEKIVLDHVTLELHPNEITGLVGPNGAGKTTLFKLIAGKMQPDSGAVSIARSTQIGYLPQEPELPPRGTLHDAVASGFAELVALEHRMHELSERMAANHASDNLQELMDQYDKLTTRFEAAGGYVMEKRLGEVLAGLGIPERDYNLPVHALSGGQRCRAALGKLLLTENSYLLLDEPTNHLDLDAVSWLEGFLRNHQGGALLISHDRYLLDQLCSRILELNNGKIKSYSGNYSTYVQTKAIEAETLARQAEQDRAFIEKERDYINRFRAGQRARQAQGRLTRLERRLQAGEFVTEGPQQQKRMSLDFGDFEVRDVEMLKIKDLSKAYGEKRLFSGLDLVVRAGSCIGITGPNGSGKSTLLKILTGQETPDTGTVKWAGQCRFGYFAQDARGLDPNAKILEEIQASFPHLSESSVRAVLGHFLFTGNDCYKKIGSLSGGEQSRVRMLKLMLGKANTLLLDEPTNHLDIMSCEVLENALLEYPGTIFVISHDRYFLDRVVDHILVIRPEGHRLIKGNYTTYAELRAKELAAQKAAEEAAAKQKQAEEKRRAAAEAERAARERAAAEEAARNAAATGAAPAFTPQMLKKSRFYKLTVEQIETEITKREQNIAATQSAFGDPANARDKAALAKLNDQLATLQAELAELMALWEVRISE
jgi:ATP-binding cassette subfamily F protein 3